MHLPWPALKSYPANWVDRRLQLSRHGSKVVSIFCMWVPQIVRAHGFGERYDLPIPMSWVIVAACWVVLLSFLLTPFLKQSSFDPAGRKANFIFQLDQKLDRLPQVQPAWTRFLKFSSVGLLILTWCTALWGSADPLMNFSPTFIWIVWWLGTSFASMLFGNVWNKLDPWLALFQGFEYLLSLVKGRKNSNDSSAEKFLLRWPDHLGRWPACTFLLLWCGFEVIYPIASMPHRIGYWIAVYSLSMWAGMWLFGPSTWRNHADGFNLYFELIGQTRAMLLSRNKEPCQVVVQNKSSQISIIALVIAIFTSVLFDGLHAGPMWLLFEKIAGKIPFIQSDVNGYLLGSLGLLSLWILLISIYLFTCFITRVLLQIGTPTTLPGRKMDVTHLDLASSFLSSLMPIAMAYLIAHNFSSFFIQGQNIIALASDPFGIGMNLWGTAQYYPDIGLIDAKVTWYVATFSIVIGHVISVFLAHRVADYYSTQFGQTKPLSSWVLNIPMTLVMIGFTALSMTIIAEPLVNA